MLSDGTLAAGRWSINPHYRYCRPTARACQEAWCRSQYGHRPTNGRQVADMADNDRQVTDSDGRWLTIAEAAQALGVSVRTVRRWAQTGKLPIRRGSRPHMVNVSGIAGQSLANTGQMPDMAAVVPDRVADLETEIGLLQGALQDATGELEELRSEIAVLQERLQELEPLESQVVSLQAALQEAREERDFLRNALAVALTRIPQLEAPPPQRKRRWWLFGKQRESE